MSKFDTSPESSTEKLAALRSELIDLIEVNQRGQSKPPSTPLTIQVKPLSQNRHAMELDAVSVARTLLNGWSRGKAGQAIYDLTEHSLKQYARKRPFKLVGISLALGVAIVLVKPWRRLPRSLPATFGSLIAVKLYQSLMSIVLKKP